MTPIYFGITRSKVKLTWAWNVKMVSAHYFENCIYHKVFIFNILIVHNWQMTYIDFRVSRSMVKNNSMSQSLESGGRHMCRSTFLVFFRFFFQLWLSCLTYFIRIVCVYSSSRYCHNFHFSWNTNGYYLWSWELLLQTPGI